MNKNTYVTACGKKFDSKKNCYKTGMVIQTRYSYKENGNHDLKFPTPIDMPEECKNCKFQKVVSTHEVFNEDISKNYLMETTVCTMNNIKFANKNKPVKYDSPCLNTKEEYTFEITLVEEDLSALIIYNAGPSKNMTPMDFFEDLVENAWEKLTGKEPYEELEDPLSIDMYDSERGYAQSYEFFEFNDFKNMVVGMRLIDQKQIILENY